MKLFALAAAVAAASVATVIAQQDVSTSTCRLLDVAVCKTTLDNLRAAGKDVPLGDGCGNTAADTVKRFIFSTAPASRCDQMCGRPDAVNGTVGASRRFFIDNKIVAVAFFDGADLQPQVLPQLGFDTQATLDPAVDAAQAQFLAAQNANAASEVVAIECETIFGVTADDLSFNPQQKDEDTMAAFSTAFGLTFLWLVFLYYLGYAKRQRVAKSNAKRAAKKAQQGPTHLHHRESMGGFRDRMAGLLQSSIKVVEDLDNEVKAQAHSVGGFAGLAGLSAVANFQDRYDVIRCYRVLTLSLQEAFVAMTHNGSVQGVENKLGDVVAKLEELKPELEKHLQTKGQNSEVLQKLVRKLHRSASKFPVYVREVAATTGDEDYEDATFIQIVKERMTWPLEGLKFGELNARMARHTALIDQAPDEPGASPHRKTFVQKYISKRLQTHPWFYGALIILYCSVAMAFFVHIDSGEVGGLFGTFLEVPPQYATAHVIDPEDSSKVIQGAENLVVPIQKIMLPMVFGVMHPVLLSLALLPFGMMRGFHRDLTKHYPEIRHVIPIDDMEFLHKTWGYLAISGLFEGAFFWFIMMGPSCLGDTAGVDPRVELVDFSGIDVNALAANGLFPGGGQAGVECDEERFFATNVLECTIKASESENACLAFNPKLVDAIAGVKQKGYPVITSELIFDSFAGELEASYFDPRDNVLYLRIVAWIVWFYWMPAILWAYTPAPNFLPWFIKKWWYEIIYYAHVLGAWATVAAALYARFEVFFPILIGWGLLIINYWVEMLFHTESVHILVDTNHKDPTTNPPASIFHETRTNKPTAVGLVFERPRTFDPGSGQWMYIMIPSIDIIWHPFSLASCTLDPTLDLHIGIRGVWDKALNSTSTQVNDWKMAPRYQTWTYKLLDMVRQKATLCSQGHGVQRIWARIRGPYGSPFTKCFDQQFPAAVVIGAGTGLTSALSVLKEILHRRGQMMDAHKFTEGEYVPQYVWFVWACREEADLDWCWRTLQVAIYDAVQKGALEMGEDWGPMTSNMLDWLGVTIYATRTKEDRLKKKMEVDIAPEETVAMEDNPMLQHHEKKQHRAVNLAGDLMGDSSDDEEELKTSRNKRFQASRRGQRKAQENDQTRLHQRRSMRRSAAHVAPPGSAADSLSVPSQLADDMMYTMSVSEDQKEMTVKSKRGSRAYNVPIVENDQFDQGGAPGLPPPRPPRSNFKRNHSILANVKPGLSSMAGGVLPEHHSEHAPELPTKSYAASAKRGSVSVGKETNVDAIGMGGMDLYGAPQQTQTLRKPSTILEQQQDPWDVGVMSRSAAEEVLLSRRNAVPGDFLVRRSDKPGRLHPVLTYLVDKTIGTFRHDQIILDDENGTYTIEGNPLRRACRSVAEVIMYLQENADQIDVQLQEYDGGEADALVKAGTLKGGTILPATMGKAGTMAGRLGIGETSVDLANKLRVGREEEVLEALLAKRNTRTAAKIRTWLEEQVITAALDDRSAPIGRLLKWVRQVVDDCVEVSSEIKSQSAKRSESHAQHHAPAANPMRSEDVSCAFVSSTAGAANAMVGERYALYPSTYNEAEGTIIGLNPVSQQQQLMCAGSFVQPPSAQRKIGSAQLLMTPHPSHPDAAIFYKINGGNSELYDEHVDVEMHLSGAGKTRVEMYAIDYAAKRCKSWSTTWEFDHKVHKKQLEGEQKGVSDPSSGQGHCLGLDDPAVHAAASAEAMDDSVMESSGGALDERTMTYSLQHNAGVEVKRPPIAVCFCGPPGLAHTLNETVDHIGGAMEFSAHSQ